MDTPARWSGRVLLEPGFLAFDGELGGAHAHAHAAVQLILVRDGSVTATDAAGRSITGTRFVIPAGASHALASAGARGTMVYLERASDAGRAATASLDREAHDSAGAWSDAGHVLGLPRSAELAGDLRELLTAGRSTGSEPAHPVVRAATEAILPLLHGPVRVGEVAATVGVSPDHLGRLFRRHLGLTFPAYVRWQRLMIAAGELRAGATLTDAAHAAGFTDSSHINRVAHEMFGVGPSEMALLVRPS